MQRPGGYGMRTGHLIRFKGGHTLLELVMVIVVLGVIGVTFGFFIVPAVNANQAVERRAALIDSADVALRRMARDIRIALPHSVRVSYVAGTGFAIETIPPTDSGRLRPRRGRHSACTSPVA